MLLSDPDQTPAIAAKVDTQGRAAGSLAADRSVRRHRLRRQLPGLDGAGASQRRLEGTA